jgi:hypothetical protein
MWSRAETEGFPMANVDRQMPSHVEVAYQDAVNNVTFLRRQQWIATNYALLVYAALFVVSAEYFSRTDFARNWLGIIAIATFLIHFYMVYLFQGVMDKSKNRFDWIYRTYFNREEQTGLDLLRSRSSWDEWKIPIGLILVSFIGLIAAHGAACPMPSLLEHLAALAATRSARNGTAAACTTSSLLGDRLVKLGASLSH